MSFHASNLGRFGDGLRTDMNGKVPEADDGPWDFAVDHGAERTHTENGGLTEYGEWWEKEGFPAWQAEALEATERSMKALAEWQEK